MERATGVPTLLPIWELEDNWQKYKIKLVNLWKKVVTEGFKATINRIAKYLQNHLLIPET